MDLQVIGLTCYMIVIGNFCVMVEARYCPIEIDGDVKYYICPPNEICCTFGCCISPSFHLYQLWYYWLLVILMFLLCSGGTWWYRYWLQPGAPPPPLPPTHHAPPPTTVSYRAGRNTVLVHQIWKPHRYPVPPPSYSLVQSSTQGGSVPGAKLKTSPYYQLYGPPPSYDSVITQTPESASTSAPVQPDTDPGLHK